MTVRRVRADDGSSAWVLEPEPEFSDDDLALLLALAELRAEEAAAASEVGSHGRPMSEAMSRDADPNDRRHGFHYVERVRVDHAARFLRAKQKERADAYPDEDAGSLVWTLDRVDDGPPAPIPEPTP